MASIEERIICVIEKLVEYENKLDCTSDPLIYFSGEGDSNQTEFERKSNHLEIGVIAKSSLVGRAALRLVRYIIDDNMELFLDDEKVDIINTISNMAKKEFEVYGHTSKIDKVFRSRLGNKTLILKEISDVDVWTLKRLMNNIKASDLKFDDDQTINQAIEKGDIEKVKLLLADPRVDPSVDNNYAIRVASENGHLEIVKLLLADPRVDPSAQNNWAIRWASRNNKAEVVKLLLADPRVDPSDENNYSIRWASRKGHTEVVKLLLADPRVDPSVDDNYAIRWATSYGHFEVVKLLNCKKN